MLYMVARMKYGKSMKVNAIIGLKNLWRMRDRQG